MLKIVLTGVQAERSEAEAHAKLATLFKTTADQVAALLRRPNFVLKSGLDEQTAERYKRAIELAGGTCRIEPEVAVTDTLDVDLPAAGSEQLAPTPTAKSASAQSTRQRVKDFVDEIRARSRYNRSRNPSSVSTSSFRILIGVLGFFVVLLGGAYVYKLVNSYTDSFNFSAYKDVSAPQLEAALRIGKSTRGDFKTFVDEGGLRTNGAWHGLHGIEVRTQYSDSGVLDSFQLEVDGKAYHSPSGGDWAYSAPVSSKEVRDILTKVCDVRAADWQMPDGERGQASRTVQGKDTLTCLYNRANTSTNNIIIVLGIEPK